MCFCNIVGRLYSRIGFATRLLPLLLVLLPVSAQAQDYTYATNNGTITITGYFGPGGAGIISKKINGLPVTTIGNYEFDLANVTSVTIPATVTSIEWRAFNYCTSLASITIPNGVISIGWGAFTACYSLTNASIPASVTSIGNQAFDYCVSLRAITVDGQNAFYSSVNGVLFDKSQSTLIQFPLASLGTYTIPSSVVSIGARAFSSSANLSAVTIPNSVTTIGGDAFSYCTSLTNIMLPPSVDRIEPSTFFHCENLTSITIPDNVNFVGSRAFAYCFSLRGVTIPSSATIITEYSFQYCTNLTSVVIPSGVTNIEGYAFQRCYNLTNVSIPDSVTGIGVNAFAVCVGLLSITVDPGNSIYSSANGVLLDKSQTTLLLCPGGKVGSFVVPSNVVNIANNCFLGCANLTTVSMPNSVTNIGSAAFAYCYSLTNVTIPTSVTVIKDALFSECTSLTGVTIPTSVTFIGSWAFANCSSLANITIPSSVTNIGDYTFFQCTNLRGIYFTGDAPGIGSHGFDNDSYAIAYFLPGTTGWDSTFGGYFVFQYTPGIPTALWQLPYPSILNFEPGFGVQTNGFGFIISWATNASVVVEGCTNLATPFWSPVGTNTLVGGSSYFSDPQWTNYPARFYRVRWP